MNVSPNSGKGAAVKLGMMQSRGNYVLFADADGATDINDLEKCLILMKANEKDAMGCVIGDRNTKKEGIQDKRHPIRKLLNFGMNTIVRIVLGF